MKYLFIILGIFFFIPHATVFAQNTNIPIHTESLDEIVSRYSFYSVTGASIFLVLLTIVSLTFKKMTNIVKKILFGTIIFTVLATTIFLAGSTIYLNTISQSGGPVHWHADLEIWSCGKELDFINPTGLSNKIGTATLHEHNDKRIHVEGVVVQEQDVSLGKFFYVIGGALTANTLVVPTNTGIVSHTTNESCSNGEPAEVQVFVYTIENGEYSQKKLFNPATYILSSEQNIPSGDCIIIEFDTPKETTDKLCRSYKVAEETGEIKKQ